MKLSLKTKKIRAFYDAKKRLSLLEYNVDNLSVFIGIFTVILFLLEMMWLFFNFYWPKFKLVLKDYLFDILKKNDTTNIENFSFDMAYFDPLMLEQLSSNPSISFLFFCLSLVLIYLTFFKDTSLLLCYCIWIYSFNFLSENLTNSDKDKYDDNFLPGILNLEPISYQQLISSIETFFQLIFPFFATIFLKPFSYFYILFVFAGTSFFNFSKRNLPYLNLGKQEEVIKKISDTISLELSINELLTEIGIYLFCFFLVFIFVKFFLHQVIRFFLILLFLLHFLQQNLKYWSVANHQLVIKESCDLINLKLSTWELFAFNPVTYFYFWYLVAIFTFYFIMYFLIFFKVCIGFYQWRSDGY